MFYGTAKAIKCDLDEAFLPAWHVIVGEEFAFDVDHEESCKILLLYGSLATLAWKVRI